MERKVNRNSPVSRGPLADSKKDGVGKPWLRGSKCREPSNGSLSSKGETGRMPPPQKFKGMDKRPKPRGMCSPAVASRSQTTLLEDELDAELGSVFIPGSKKQSLNHLLNFTYTSPPTGSSYQSDRNIRGFSRNGKKSHISPTQKHKYKKEVFLQANCQFIVHESGDYKKYLNNPDALVDWQYVEQVNVQVSEYPSCPICLYTPSAAKMTLCGHIYCWPCILHYLSLSDERSRKCPICFEYVRKTELISVVTVPYNCFNVNDTITFRLMKTPRGGLIAYPADLEVKEENNLFHVSEKNAKDIYSKLLLAKRNDIQTIIAREKSELDILLKDNEGCPEECFIQEAMRLLADREQEALNRIIGNGDYEEELTLSDLDISNSSLKCITEEEIVVQSPSDGVSKYRYFYQAHDGQHIYLNPLNAKMLEHTYGSLEFAPRILTGKILEKEGGSMTLELRKRMRCLQHLPITCQFEVAEIDLKPPIVSKDTLSYFHEKLEARRKARNRKDRDENRREKLIELEENRKIGIYPTPNLQIESNVQFPEFGTDLRLRSESESTMMSERSSSPDLDSRLSNVPLEQSHAGPSFAKMLASKKTQPPLWPSLGLSPDSAYKPKLINVTGSKMSVNKPKITSGSSDTELDPEGYEPVPSYSASFCDGIGRALEAAETETDQRTSSKKKKKFKQKVLFTTNIAYSEK